MYDDRELKRIEQKRREARRNQWLTRASWATVVSAFAGFFVMWHGMSQAAAGTRANTGAPVVTFDESGGQESNSDATSGDSGSTRSDSGYTSPFGSGTDNSSSGGWQDGSSNNDNGSNYGGSSNYGWSQQTPDIGSQAS